MRSHAKRRGSVADGYGATGVFKTTASGLPFIGLPSNAEQPAEGRKDDEPKYSTWPQFVAAAIVNVHSFASGSALAWPAMALPQLTSAESGLRARPLTADQASWVASLSALGGLLFLPAFAALSAHVDRKTLGFLLLPLQLAAWATLMWSTSVAALYTARVLGSAHGSGMLLLSLLYVGETATDASRGALGSLLALLANGGILFGYLLGAYLPYHAVLYANVVPLLLFAVLFFFVPETPYRLVSTGRHQEARKALRWLRRGISEEQVEREMAIIRASLGPDGAKQGGEDRRPLAELLCSRESLVGIAIGVLLCVNQQFCGSFAVSNYAVFIFNEAGGSLSSEVATIILGILQVIGGVLSAPLVDRMGRRAILFASNAAVGASAAIIGVYFYLKAETQLDVSCIGWLPVTCLSVYMVMLAFGLCPLPYIVISEIVAPRIRGVAAIGGFSIVCLTGGTMVKVYPLMTETMGEYGTFWFFASVCALCSVIIWFVLPETKGRPLADIIRELNGGKGVIRT